MRSSHRMTLLPAALAGAALLSLATPPAGAADPLAGVLSKPGDSLAWTGGPMTSFNPSTAACVEGVSCDTFELELSVPPGKVGVVRARLEWASAGDDFDLYVYDSAGNAVGSSANGGTSSERVFIDDASGAYEVRVLPWNVTDSGYTGGARVESRAQVGGEVPQEPLSNVPCTDGTAGPVPRGDVHLEGFLPLAPHGHRQLNDILGWTDPQTRSEDALVGKR